MKGGDWVTSISEGDTVSILVRLKNNDGPMIMQQFEDVVCNYSTRKDRIRKLEEDGLVDVREVFSPQKLLRVELTEKGGYIGTLLNIMDKTTLPDLPPMEKSIGQRYADPVLRMGLTRQRVKYSEVNAVLPYPGTLKSLYGMMEREGLIRLGEDTSGRHYKYFELTPTGRAVAQGFKEIFNLVRKEEVQSN